jgi:hypothetical protein
MQARKVLEGVERISWDTAACLCFAGSAKASMRFLGEKVTDDYVMGISGGAFSMFWGMPWSPANVDLLVIGEEPVKRSFDALGFDYTLIAKGHPGDKINEKEPFRKMIVESIDRGIPVIAKGVVGPPECCVIAGYDGNGDVLHGWSYYQGIADFYKGIATEYFSTDRWFENCHGLIIIGEKKQRPSRRQVLQDTLEWAIRLGRVPEFLLFAEGRPYRFMSGLAAYEAMAEALLRDEDFPDGDLDVLTSRCVSISNDGIPLLSYKRKSATRFLNGMAGEGLPGADELRRSAEEYNEEVRILDEASVMAPFTYAPEGERLRLADPAHRRGLSRLVRAAKAQEERAVECLESALAELAGN